MLSTFEKMDSSLLYLKEAQVKELLDWPEVIDAVKQALLSVSSSKDDENHPISSQPARTATFVENNSGILFSMPGFIGNYKLPTVAKSPETRYDTLGCKLVTGFTNNPTRSVPLPSVLGSILLMDSQTGQLNCIMGGTEITTWRTGAASIVATKHLFFNRRPSMTKIQPSLAIIGCSTQGRIHAIGMCTTFNIKSIFLWNRTSSKAINLSKELNEMRHKFINPNIEIVVCNSGEQCVLDADIIVTATFADSPVLLYNWIKKNVHINAVGAGKNHHSELDPEIYANSKIYVDNYASSKTELKTLNYPIEGEIGEILNESKTISCDQHITIFQSMGMAVEDCAVGQLIYEKYKSKNLQIE